LSWRFAVRRDADAGRRLRFDRFEPEDLVADGDPIARVELVDGTKALLTRVPLVLPRS